MRAGTHRSLKSWVVPELHRRNSASLELNYVDTVISVCAPEKGDIVVQEKRRRMDFDQGFEYHNLAKRFGQSSSYAKILVSVQPRVETWPDNCLDVLQI